MILNEFFNNKQFENNSFGNSEPEQRQMDANRRGRLGRERNAGLDEPDDVASEPVQKRNGVYEYIVPAGQEDIAQELGLQQHRGHWVSRVPIQRANFQFGRPQFHEIPSQGVAEGTGQIDELSPGTLNSYVNKARAQVRASPGANPNNSHLPTDPKIANRARGAVKADNRLHGFGPGKKSTQGVAEAATPASVSKVLRLIQRHHSDWFDTYGMGEVEDAVVDMAEMGQFRGTSAAVALKLVGDELESMYGQQGVAEGGAKDRQWSNKDMERLRVATKDFDDIMASDGPDQTKHDLIKKRIQTKPITGPKGQLPEQGVAEADELRARGGLAAVNKKPRIGQTDMRDIPVGNHPDARINKFTDRDREEHPSRLKATIKSTLGKHTRPNLPEGVVNTKSIITESKTYKLWESAGQKLVEAQLTVDQINQIFQQVEQGATAAGGNRTMIGRGKDAAEEVNKAWETLKDKVATSGPIKNVDAMYDKAADQLKQATGGDQGVMTYVQKYRDFAKKHPVAQSLIYSALIAAAGISGAGLGGAAALGLFKMVDKLLQGEKFSSAAYQGAKTGGMAYAAGQIGQAMKGEPQGGAGSGTGSGEVPSDIQQGLAADQAFQDRILNKFPPDKGYTFGSNGNSFEVFDSTGRKVFTGDIPLKTMDMKTFADLTNNGQMATPGITSGSISSDPMAGVSNAGSGATNTVSGITGDQMVNHPAYQAMIQKFGNTPGARQAAMSAAKAAIAKGQMNESVNLSESQIYLVIGNIVERQRKLDEGIMDTIKGAAGKAVDWAKTKGTNLTTKITADKLLQAWKKADSPTDSLDVAKVIQNAGVPSASIKQVYNTMNIPFAGEPGGGAMPQSAAPQVAQSVAKAAQPVAKVGIASRVAQPAAKAASPQAVQPVAKPDTGLGYNAANVMKLDGMEKYAKPAPAKTANFAIPSSYGKNTTSIKPPAASKAPAEKQQQGVAEGEKIGGLYDPVDFDAKLDRMKANHAQNPSDFAALAARLQAAYKNTSSDKKQSSPSSTNESRQARRALMHKILKG